MTAELHTIETTGSADLVRAAIDTVKALPDGQGYVIMSWNRRGETVLAYDTGNTIPASLLPVYVSQVIEDELSE